MKKTQADMIRHQWESLPSDDEKCAQWSSLLDHAIEIGEDFHDWTNDITYVRFQDGSILGWDCFFIRPATEGEINVLTQA